MKSLAWLSLLASTTFAGNEFFTNNSPAFWKGVDSVKFSQPIEETYGILTRNIHSIEKFGWRYQIYDNLDVWIDSTSKTQYFVTKYVRNINCHVVRTAGSGKTQNDVTLSRIGLKTILVGNKSTGLIVMAFTFYNGSDEFKRKVNSKYINEEPEKGLFSWTINVKDFKHKFMTNLLDSVGYGRECWRFGTNCQIKDEDNAGGRIVTKDESVYIGWRKGRDLIDIHLRADYVISFPKACRTNFFNWVYANEKKHPGLD